MNVKNLREHFESKHSGAYTVVRKRDVRSRRPRGLTRTIRCLLLFYLALPAPDYEALEAAAKAKIAAATPAAGAKKK